MSVHDLATKRKNENIHDRRAPVRHHVLVTIRHVVIVAIVTIRLLRHQNENDPDQEIEEEKTIDRETSQLRAGQDVDLGVQDLAQDHEDIREIQGNQDHLDEIVRHVDSHQEILEHHICHRAR